MVIFAPSVEIAIALLAGVALMYYGGFAAVAHKELGYVGAGAFFLLLSGMLPIIGEDVPVAAEAVEYMRIILVLFAFVLVIIASLVLCIRLMQAGNEIEHQ